jgi:hypothetical protein
MDVQDHLRSGNSIDSLTADFGINVYRHPTEPLVGLKYDQIRSPKTHPIVRECRGLVLVDHPDLNWACAARPFRRFFNAGEVADEFQKFDWGNFTCTEKCDGSIIILYEFNRQWRVNTSGSFGDGEVPFSGTNWRKLFFRTWEQQASRAGLTRNSIRLDALDPASTYLFELCTPYNKVVRQYPEPTVFLLSSIRTAHGRESSEDENDDIARELGVARPERYRFHSQVEITEYLSEKQRVDPTFEGVVIRDDQDLRFKIKTDTYVFLHHLIDNGNLFNPKRLVPRILAGERDEIVAYVPEIREAIDKVQSDLDAQFTSLADLWGSTWQLPNQREFADQVKHHPFSSVLFTMRKKYGPNQDLDALDREWRSIPDRIVRRLYG